MDAAARENRWESRHLTWGAWLKKFEQTITEVVGDTRHDRFPDYVRDWYTSGLPYRTAAVRYMRRMWPDHSGVIALPKDGSDA